LNVGCGNDYVEEWDNLDGNPDVKADIYCDLEYDVLHGYQKYDIIYASHILEHVHNLVEVKAILSEMLKPGGLFIVIVPDYLSMDAWGDDTHCRAFSRESFLSSFWPGFIDGEVREITLNKTLGSVKWLAAILVKGE
jgi:SAM-dependent methyltransferase